MHIVFKSYRTIRSYVFVIQHLERYLVCKALRELYRLQTEVYMLLIMRQNTTDRPSTAVFCYTLEIEREMNISPSKFLFVYSTPT